MLKVYLISVVIWMIIIFCTTYLFAEQIKQKGWIETNKHGSFFKALFNVFCMSVVPLLRLLFLITILLMAGVTKEEFEEMTRKNE